MSSIQDEDETWRKWLDRVADERLPFAGDDAKRALRDFALNLRDAMIREEEATAARFASGDTDDRTERYAAAIWVAGSTRPWGMNNDIERSRYRRHARAAIRVADQERGWDARANASNGEPPSSEESWWADAKRAADQASEAMELVGGEMTDQEVRAAALRAAYGVGEYQQTAARSIEIAREFEEYIRNG